MKPEPAQVSDSPKKDKHTKVAEKTSQEKAKENPKKAEEKKQEDSAKKNFKKAAAKKNGDEETKAKKAAQDKRQEDLSKDMIKPLFIVAEAGVKFMKFRTNLGKGWKVINNKPLY